MTPTPEQQAIIEATRSTNTSLMISAMAGTAKTTTLEMLSKVLPVKPTLALAFNVKIKNELIQRLPKHFEVKTMNGLGNAVWQRAIGKYPKVNKEKLFATTKETIKDFPESNWSTIQILVKGARISGLVPTPISNQFVGLVPDDWDSWEAIGDRYYLDISDSDIAAARACLTKMIHKSFRGEIDYDDQIYMSSLFGGVFPRFQHVLVDEAQDLSILNHIQVRKSCVDRLIVCGDPRQAIYAFRGADSSSMVSLRALQPVWLDFPLSVTFRCPARIVERQQIHAPGFTARDPAPLGEVHDWQGKDWSITEIQECYPNKHIAILSRNNAPIISACLRIIKRGIGCTVLGNEIGKSLITLSKKILPAENINTQDCEKRIQSWREKETSLARANKKFERIDIITDRAECLLAVLHSQPDLTSKGIRAILETMFSKESLSITLGTIHKAKGLEYPIVVHLDSWRLPSKFALKAKDEGNLIPMEQEMNLKYVCETRSQHTLILANLTDMR